MLRTKPNKPVQREDQGLNAKPLFEVKPTKFIKLDDVPMVQSGSEHPIAPKKG